MSCVACPPPFLTDTQTDIAEPIQGSIFVGQHFSSQPYEVLFSCLQVLQWKANIILIEEALRSFLEEHSKDGTWTDYTGVMCQVCFLL